MSKPDLTPYALGRDFAGALSRFERHNRRVMLRSSLGQADSRLLWLLADRGPCTLREIGEQLGLEQSTVNRQVNVALDEGIVERRREPGSTAYVVTPTEHGLERLRTHLHVVLGGYDVALRALGDDDAKALIDLLRRFAEQYQDETGDD